MRHVSASTSLSLSPRLRLPDAARYLGISPRSLADRGWRQRHGIPCFRVGRALVFDVAALDRWLARHAERPLRTLECLRDKEGGEQ